MKEAFDFLALGGPIMFVLASCSVAALAVFIERMIALQRRRVVPERFQTVILNLLRDGKIDEARALCESNESALAAVLAAGIKRAGQRPDRVREAVLDRGRREAIALERFTGIIGAVATVSPLLGLLGTITGMIQTFQSVQGGSSAGQLAAGTLATGIWEALITTAAGLCVAIPAFLGHRILIAKIDSLVGSLEEAALETVDLVSVDDGPGGAKEESA